MNDIFEQRPQFFEGQYLGADDLEQLVTYVRDLHARHVLAGHSFGIGMGLELVEQDSPSGALDVFLLPGYAVDGYGHCIVVPNPLRLTVDLFSAQTSDAIPVWLRYDEGETRGVRPGFEVCAASDSYSRIAESYVIEAGYFSSPADRSSGADVSGEAVDDPRTAPRTFDDNGPIVCDASLPYQTLPRPPHRDRWLIPLGAVGWQQGSPGKIVKLTDPQRMLARTLRRYQSVVAEGVLAPGGVIRLRDRYTPFDPAMDTETSCAADAVQLADLAVCNGKVGFNELIWLEGRVRITGDARLFGTKLEFRDGDGTEFSIDGANAKANPILLQRVDNNERGGSDLQILVGQSKDGRNRLAVAQVTKIEADPTTCEAKFTAQNRVVMQDDGKVGIGTGAPDKLLTLVAEKEAYLHATATGSGHQVLLGADDKGAVLAATGTEDLIVRTNDDKDRITVKSDGKVGVGTAAPDRNVTVEGAGAAYLNVRSTTTVNNVTSVAHEGLIGADSSGAIVSGMQAADDLQLRSGGNVTHAVIKADGKVGVGTVSPDREITVEGSSHAYINARTAQGPHEVLVGADASGAIVSAMTNDDLQLRAGTNSTKVWIKANGNVGVGTSAPNDKLDVRGNVRLGAGDLFAAGGVQNLKILIGAVSDSGVGTSGSGFNATRLSEGIYRVTFTTAMGAAPVVLATPLGSANDDNIVTVTSVSANSFEVHIKDMLNNGSEAQAYQNTAFSFVAFGLR
jgi:hypothetical protein